ncbi:MAG: ionic transporter y4hA [Actinobacteria bacterium]|nr:ionic transporter y4hA [Actinomycetota bacterium]
MDRDALTRRVSASLPFLGLVLLVLTWGRSLPPVAAVLLAFVHVAVVMAAVGHAEDIAHRVGEPFGTLVLAIAVTVIEVALIVTLMATDGAKAATLARDTVFAAIMIVCNGIVGVCLVLAARREHTVRFSEQGAHALLGTVLTLATLSLVMPTFTQSSSGPTFTASQLAFSAIASATVYGIFVFVQTRRLRWMFLDTGADTSDTVDSIDGIEEELALERAPIDRRAIVHHGALLVVSLVAVVGLAKTLSPSIEDAIVWAGAPQSFVGVVIALMVLLPESVAAFRAASRGQMQTSLNLSLGSALASIGLTIPAIAIASIWLDGEIMLGLGSKEIVLLVLTAVVSILTFGSGRATVLQATHHLVVFAAFVFLAIVP